jgi:hypothetical protein
MLWIRGRYAIISGGVCNRGNPFRSQDEDMMTAEFIRIQATGLALRSAFFQAGR